MSDSSSMIKIFFVNNTKSDDFVDDPITRKLKQDKSYRCRPRKVIWKFLLIFLFQAGKMYIPSL